MIFVNLPITDLQRARDFYAGLGFTFNETFSDDSAACVVVSDRIFFMIMTRERFASFAPRPVGHPDKETSVLLALSRDSRAAVDNMTEAAVAHGGTDTGKVNDIEGMMYGRSFSDPDGNVIELVWMAPATA